MAAARGCMACVRTTMPTSFNAISADAGAAPWTMLVLETNPSNFDVGASSVHTYTLLGTTTTVY